MYSRETSSLRIDGAGGGAPVMMKIERAAPIGAALVVTRAWFARSVLGNRDADEFGRRAAWGGDDVESDGHGRGCDVRHQH
jgi:hypothetical protein